MFNNSCRVAVLPSCPQCCTMWLRLFLVGYCYCYYYCYIASLVVVVVPQLVVSNTDNVDTSSRFVVSGSSVECELDGTCRSTDNAHDNDEIEFSEEEEEEEDIDCGLYMAESTISNTGAGYGVYYGGSKPLPKDTLLDMYNDVVIQYVDLQAQRNLQTTYRTNSDNNLELLSSSDSDSTTRSTTGTSSSSSSTELPKLLFRDYFWKSSETFSYYDANDIKSIAPGFGMISNCALGLVNHIMVPTSCNHRRRRSDRMSTVRNTTEVDDTDRNDDTNTTTTTTTKRHRWYPSTGASSSYQDCYFSTSQTIPVGHEMFDNYGDDWFLSRRKRMKPTSSSSSVGTDPTTTTPIIPLTDDYSTADTIVKLWQQHTQKQQQQQQQQEETTTTTNTNDRISDDNITSDLYETVILKGITPHLTTGTQHALPMTSQDAMAIDYDNNNSNNTHYYNTVAYQGLTNHTAIRSMEWLREHGMCLDHIIVQPIIGFSQRNDNDYNHSNHTKNDMNHYNHRPQERGAFARRFRPKGALVAPAPLIHLSRRHTDMIYADMTGGIPKTILWQGHQLLLNYCYGHPLSSLLLFPYSHGVNLINHPTTTTATDQQQQRPNVGLRWSKRMRHPEWLQYNVSQLLDEHNDHSGLMMEFYALHDIEKGEEILYDYGDDWQRAWEMHVEVWNRRTHVDGLAAVVHAGEYISALEYEQQCHSNRSQSGQNSSSHLDQQQQEEEHDVAYHCLTNVPSWIELRCYIAEYDTVVSTTKNDEWYDWVAPAEAEYNKLTSEYDYYGMIDETFPCEVQNRSDKSSSSSSSIPSATNRFNVRLLYDERESFDDGHTNITNVPRSAIVMVDRPYTGNQFLRQSFRHEIRLPDDMLPESWKDLQPNPNSRCGLYMAESAIPFSGLGMYTGIEIGLGEKLFSGDVVVQVEDIDLNTKLRHWAINDYEYKKEKDWLLNNYYWSPEMSLGVYEANSVQSIIPGFGMLANSHTGLVNANFRTPKRYFRLQRGHDPGTGSSTTFHNVYFQAKKGIEAGAELFVQYGDEWFADREDLGSIPLSTDFKVADRTVKLLLQVMDNLTVALEHQTQDFVNDFLSLVRHVAATRPRLANAFPKDFNSFELASEEGTATLTVPNRVRTIEWLEENGRCLDNIRPELSTIRQAGRGAFATRNMKKGDVITPLPLVHVRRRHMDIYHGDDYDDKEGKFWKDGQQLLLNYCYGHPESSLLLFPYAPISNYINHNVSQSNTGLRWSTLPNHHDDWLQRSPDSLDDENHSGLIMELVATKDIAPNEEIFLNYGPQWEASWNKFRKNQKLNDYDRHFTSSEELNDRIEWLKTVDEQEDEPYEFSNNEDIRTICFMYRDKKNLIANATDTSLKTYRWSGTERLFQNDYSFPCDVIDRNLKMYDYDEVYSRHDSVLPVPITYTVILVDEDIQVVDVPRKAIQFFDNEYMSDNSWRKAFRHEIHLPDHMVPPMWRDLNPSYKNDISTIS